MYAAFQCEISRARLGNATIISHCHRLRQIKPVGHVQMTESAIHHAGRIADHSLIINRWHVPLAKGADDEHAATTTIYHSPAHSQRNDMLFYSQGSD